MESEMRIKIPRLADSAHSPAIVPVNTVTVTVAASLVRSSAGLVSWTPGNTQANDGFCMQAPSL